MNVFAPSEQLKIAPQLIAGLEEMQEHESREGGKNLPSLTGLESIVRIFSAINCGAINKASLTGLNPKRYFLRVDLKMSDLLGLLFFVLLIAGIFIGLKILAKPTKRTEAEFERNAAENKTMLGASMNALQEMMNPEAAKAKEVQTQLKEGRYDKKKREGKANGEDDSEEEKI